LRESFQLEERRREMDQILFRELVDSFLYFRNGINLHVNLQRQNFITEIIHKSKIIRNASIERYSLHLQITQMEIFL